MDIDLDEIADDLNPGQHEKAPEGFESLVGFVLDRDWGEKDLLQVLHTNGLFVARETNDPQLHVIGPAQLVETALGQFALSEGLDEPTASALVERLRSKVSCFHQQ